MPPLLSAVGKRKTAGVRVARFDPSAVNRTPPNPEPWTFDPPKLAKKMARLKRKLKFVSAIQKLRKRLGLRAWKQAVDCALGPGLGGSPPTCPIVPHHPDGGCCFDLDHGFKIIEFCVLKFKSGRREPQLLFKSKCQSCAHETPMLTEGGAINLMGAPKWEAAQKQRQGPLSGSVFVIANE